MNKFKKAVSITTALMTIVSMSGVAGLASVASATTIVDGDLIKTASNPDVYVVKLVGSKMFKRLILSPSVFNSYGHLKWSNIKTVSQAEMDQYTVSALVRALNDTKVYSLIANGDTGTRQWLNMTADAFTAAGYDWSSIYVINNTDRDSYTLGSDITSGSTTPTTGFSVALASDSPAAVSIPKSADHVAFAKFTFTGTATINTLTITRGGVGSTSDFSNVYLYDGDTRLVNGRTVNSSTNQATFTSLNLAVSGSRTITVMADVAGTAGNQNYFQISAATDVSATATLSGTFPVRGNTMSLAGSQAGTITIAKTGSIANPYVGSSQAEVSRFTLAGATEDMTVKTITLYNAGSVTTSALTNLTLKINSTTVATGTGFDTNGRAVLTFTNGGYLLVKGSTMTANLYADVAGKPADTVILYVDADADVYAVGSTYGYGAVVTRTMQTTATAHSLTLQGGQMTIAFNGPTSKTVGTNTDNTTLLDFNMTAASEVEVRQMQFYICFKTVGGSGTETQVKNELQDIKLSDGTTSIMGPTDGSGWTAAASTSVCPSGFTGSFYKTWSDSFTMTAGSNRHLYLTADIKSATYLLSTDQLAAVLINPASVANSMRYTSSNTYLATGDIVPSTNVTGNTMTLGASSITPTLGTNPTGMKTYIKGNTGKDAVQLLVTAGTASDMTLTDLTLTSYVSDGAVGGAENSTWYAGKDNTNTTYPMYAKDLVSNVSLYDGTNLVSGPKGFSGTDYKNVVFSGMTLAITAGQQKALTVKIDLANTSASSTYDFVAFGIADASTDISANDSKGTTVHSTGSVNAISGTNAPTTYVRKADGGSLAVATNSAYTPLGAAMYMSQTQVPMNKIRFTATTEAFTVDTLTLQIDTTAMRTDVSKVTISYPTATGSTESKDGYFGSTASITFSGLNFYIPADNYAYLTVNADMKTYVNGATSKDAFSIDFGAQNSTATGDFRATGNGGTVIAASSVTKTNAATGNNMYLYRSYPKFEFTSSASGSSTAIPTNLAKFKVTNMGENDMTFNNTSGQMKFAVVASGTSSQTSVLTLYDDDTSNVLGTANVVMPASVAASGYASATFNFNSLAVTLTAGAVKNFRIDMTSGTSFFNKKGMTFQLVLRDETNVIKWVDNASTTQIGNTATVKGLGTPLTGNAWSNSLTS